MTRDPRVDPRPGDVLAYTVEGVRWTRTVTGRKRSRVLFDRQSPDGAHMLLGAAESSLAAWQEQMASASIVHVAPTPEPSR